MNLHIENLFNRYCYETKKYTTYELTPGEYPYYISERDDIEDKNREFQYRVEYVDLCVKNAMNIWNKCKFSDELIVLYEDKYDCHYKKEKEFVESTLKSLDHQEYLFKWYDEEEIYQGRRYIWKTNKIDTKKLFRKIILSDIGEDTALDCAVYIIDNKTKNVFFIYDDRGIDIYSDSSR